MKTKIITKLMMFTIAFATAFGAQAGNVNFSYIPNGDGENTITITGINAKGSLPHELIIPSEYKGMVVTRLSANPAEDNSDAENLRLISLPKTIIAIEDNPFVRCESLEIVEVESGGRYKTRDNMLLSVDEKELVAVYGGKAFNRTSIKIPDTVEILCNYALLDSRRLKTVTIPKNVKEIRFNPFIGCESLERIDVDPQNKFFTVKDGCLLSKDGRRMIALAGSYVEDRDVVIPSGVEIVEDCALESRMVNIRSVWFPPTLKNMVSDFKDGNEENIYFTTTNRFEILDDGWFDCGEIRNVYFFGPVPIGFTESTWDSLETGWDVWDGVVKNVYYTKEYEQEWLDALREISECCKREGVEFATEGKLFDPEELKNVNPYLSSFPSEAQVITNASVYEGYLSDEGAVVGTIQAKVAKPKLNRKTNRTEAKVTVSIQFVGEKKIMVKGDMDAATGVFTGETKDGRTLSLTFGMDVVSGAFDGLEVVGNRNLFSSKDTSEKAEAVLEPWLGAMNMFLGGESRRDGVIAPLSV